MPWYPPTRKKSPKKPFKGPRKHIIHKAVKWKKLLDEGKAGSLSEIAKREKLTRARVTQIMNLLRLPADFQKFLASLKDPKEIRKYSERRLRAILLALPSYEHSGKSADEIISCLISSPKETAKSSS